MVYNFSDGEKNTDWLKPQGSPAQLRDLLAAEQALLTYYSEGEGEDPDKAARVQKRVDDLKAKIAELAPKEPDLGEDRP